MGGAVCSLVFFGFILIFSVDKQCGDVKGQTKDGNISEIYLLC